MVFPDDDRQVIVQKLVLVVEGRPDTAIDLTQDKSVIKKTVSYYKDRPFLHSDILEIPPHVRKFI